MKDETAPLLSLYLSLSFARLAQPRHQCKKEKCFCLALKIGFSGVSIQFYRFSVFWQGSFDAETAKMFELTEIPKHYSSVHCQTDLPAPKLSELLNPYSHEWVSASVHMLKGHFTTRFQGPKWPCDNLVVNKTLKCRLHKGVYAIQGKIMGKRLRDPVTAGRSTEGSSNVRLGLPFLITKMISVDGVRTTHINISRALPVLYRVLMSSGFFN